MEITVKHEPGNQQFVAESNGDIAGRMEYHRVGENDHIMIITHTEVDERYKGMGVGKKLVLEAVKLARTEKFQIKPLCPFAKSVMERDTQMHDVLLHFDQ